MKMRDIIVIAKEKDVYYKVGMSKADLIRALQTKEGYTACFQRQDFCEEKEFLWMDDCIPSRMIFS